MDVVLLPRGPAHCVSRQLDVTVSHWDLFVCIPGAKGRINKLSLHLVGSSHLARVREHRLEELAAFFVETQVPDEPVGDLLIVRLVFLVLVEVQLLEVMDWRKVGS